VSPVPRSGPLNGFLVADLTFVGNQGWALGTVGCTAGSGRCPAIAHSTNDGRRWQSIKPPAVHVAVPGLDTGDCTAPCVTSIRFATPGVGYLYGGGAAGALLMTTDGGNHWQRQSGNADALESLDGNVIKISDGGGCPPGCTYRASTAAIGSSSWKTVRTLPSRTTNTGVLLSRTGSRAFALELGHPAGGAQDARSTLWVSADDGHHWADRGEPCPQGPHEADSVALTSAPDGSVTLLCRVRSAAARQFTVTSTNGGASFTSGSRTALGSGEITALGAASSAILLVSSDDTYRSADGGHHFARLGAQGGSSPGQLGWLGFASSQVAHAISVDRRTIWVTTDGGRSWRAGKLR
jgi:photosystem II stability/assembly factor-like uncharacterized protein